MYLFSYKYECNSYDGKIVKLFKKRRYSFKKGFRILYRNIIKVYDYLILKGESKYLILFLAKCFGLKQF
jgi:hypothetical protein